jgi:GNAT superfamily N-acetyltransferase
VALVHSAYRGESSQQGWTTEADLLDGQRTDAEEVHGLMSREESCLLLALRDGTLLGCCHIERKRTPGKDVDACYFGMFAVTPTLQGGGVGGALLAEAERYVRVEWGCGEMHMTVIDVRAELIAWYERRGYRRTGEHSPFPYGNDRFGVPKRPDLRFELLVKGLEPRSFNLFGALE